MPSAPKRVCPRGHPSYLGRRCPVCEKIYNRERGNADSRGYTRQWKTFKQAFLSRHVFCETDGCFRKPTDVHHIKRVRDYPNLMFDENNCRALCHSCHSKITMTEDVNR